MQPSESVTEDGKSGNSRLRTWREGRWFRRGQVQWFMDSWYRFSTKVRTGMGKLGLPPYTVEGRKMSECKTSLYLHLVWFSRGPPRSLRTGLQSRKRNNQNHRGFRRQKKEQKWEEGGVTEVDGGRHPQTTPSRTTKVSGNEIWGRLRR